MEQIKVGFKKYDVIESLEKNDIFESFKARRKEKYFLVKRYFQDFGKNATALQNLKKCGVEVPKIIKIDRKQTLTIQEFIEGTSILDIVKDKDIPEEIFEKFFLMHRKVRLSRIDLNYLPENFVLANEKIYYTSLDYYKEDKSIGFADFGIKYWFPTPELKHYLKEKGYQMDSSRIKGLGETNKAMALLCIKYW